MRDILWLRIFTVIAAACLILYFYFLPEPLLTPVYWNILFVTLNIFWIARLLLERRPVQLTADEIELCELVFRLVSPREMISLLKIGTWETAEANECLIAVGSEMDKLMLIQSGRACLIVDGAKTQIINPGQFVGSISFITDEIAPADFVALESTRYLQWDKSSLKRYLTKNPELHAAIQATLSMDLTEKLKTSWSPKTRP
jgi:CRP-like cAMP-binding protein